MKILTLFLLFFMTLFAHEKVSLQLQWFDQFQFAGYYMAKEKGFYSDAGFDVKIKKFKIGLNVVKEVMSGRATYATGRTSLLESESSGDKVVLMSAIFQTSPLVLITKKSSGINTIEDFMGKKAVLTGTESSAGIFAMLASHGVTKKDIKVINSKDKIQKFIDGDVDIISAYTSNQVYILRQKGIDINVFNPKDFGFDFYSDFLFTSQQEYLKNPQMVIDFNKASLKGWKYAFSHIGETIKLILRKYNSQHKTDDQLFYEAIKLKELAYRNTNELGTIDKSRIKQIYEIYKVMGYIKKPIDIDSMILDKNVNKLHLSLKEKEWIKKHPILKYSEVNWKPLSIIENGRMRGIFGDFLDLVSKKSGLRFRYVPSSSWKEVIDKFKDGDIDFIPSNPQNLDLGLVSRVYKKYPMVIVTGDKYKYVSTLEDLSGKSIAVPKYYTSYNYLIKNYPNIKIIVTKDIPKALELVENGKADAFIGHIATSIHCISNLNFTNLKIAGATEFEFKHSYLIQKKYPLLLSIINKTLDSISTQEREKIYSKWANVSMKSEIDYGLIAKILFFVALIFLFLAYRNRELKKYNAKTEKLKERLELALMGNNDGVWDRSFIEKSLYLSPKWKEIIGYKDDEIKNESDAWRIRVHPDDLGAALKDIQDHIDGKSEFYENVHRLKHKDGHWVWVLDRGKKILDENGKIVRMIGTQTDITQKKLIEQKLKQQEDTLRYQANYDLLTDLPNRVLFADRLKQSIEMAKRHKKKFAIFFIDLDRFKQINDSLGHEIGDEVLKRVGSKMKFLLRKEDTLARLGGDEFVVITGNISKSKDMSLLADKIITALKKPLMIKSHKLYISASIGISIYPNDGKDIKNLLKYADSAMYKAKDEGRDNYQFYSPEMTKLALQRIALENDLHQAIKNRDFIVYYQPQIDVFTEKIIGMEALVRWIHPTKGMISPAEFIPLAEDTGMIVEIDKFVMIEAMKQIKSWSEKGLNPGVLALNLSMKHLYEKNFINFMKDNISKYNIQAKNLELEVTESQVMKNPKEMILKLKKLSDIGIKIAVDDFGTGYSSLSYLKRLPIDKLKIDQSFVRFIPDSEEDTSIVKAIIALANSLNLELIAEGVEEIEQKDFLQDIGCKNIQGYYYSKPITPENLEKLFL